MKNPSKEGPGGVKSLLSENAPTSNWKYEGLRINTGGSDVILGWPRFGECCANNPLNFGIQNRAGVIIIAGHYFCEMTGITAM